MMCIKTKVLDTIPGHHTLQHLTKSMLARPNLAYPCLTSPRPLSIDIITAGVVLCQ